MLFDPEGHPIAPREIVARIKQINPLLDLKWMARATGGFHWAVASRWPEGNPRWRTVQNGQYSEEDAWDLVCFLPEDCSVEEAYGYIAAGFRNGCTDDIKSYLEGVTRYNKAREKEIDDSVLEPIFEEIEMASNHLVEGEVIKSLPKGRGSRRGKTAKELIS